VSNQNGIIWQSKELQAAILGLKIVEKDLRKEILKRSRELILKDWDSAVADEISTVGGDIYATRLTMRNTRVKVGTQGFTLQAATRGTKATSGGLISSQHYYLAEFGADKKVVPVNGRRGATNYQYKRTVNTGFQRRVKNGRYAFKAAGKIMTRTIALYTQTTIQMIYKAFEGG
jgi:hypothetical protein